MDRKLEAQLKASFPSFFQMMHASPKDTNRFSLMQSCSCREGWYPVLQWAAEQYENLARKHNIEIYAVQVKEKYGQLEVYINSGEGSAWAVCREEAQAISEEVRSRSMASCEFCGDTNEDGAECETRTSRGGYWIRTLCLSCRVVDELDQQDFPKARALLERLLEENQEKSD